MSDDKPLKPGVTEEIPTLPRKPPPDDAPPADAAPSDAASDQVPTQERPQGKVILGGAAAEEAITARRPDAPKTEAGEPAGPAGGSRVGRTLPSEDDDVAPPRAAPTRVDVVEPGGAGPRPAPAPARAAPPQRSGGAGMSVVLGGLLALAVLGGVGIYGFYWLRSSKEHDEEKDAPATTAAKPAETPSTPAPASTPEPAPSPTETAAPAPTETSTTTPPSSTTTPGTKPTAVPSGTATPTAAPSFPSWIPTSLPTAIPTALPSGFPFPSGFPTAPPPQ